MPKLSQTKGKVKLTFMSKTFMKTPKLNSEQKGVEKLVFLWLRNVHGRALIKRTKGVFNREKCMTHVSIARSCFCLGGQNRRKLCNFAFGDFPKLCFSTLNSPNLSLIITLKLPHHSNHNFPLSYRITYSFHGQILNSKTLI